MFSSLEPVTLIRPVETRANAQQQLGLVASPNTDLEWTRDRAQLLWTTVSKITATFSGEGPLCLPVFSSAL